MQIILICVTTLLLLLVVVFLGYSKKEAFTDSTELLKTYNDTLADVLSMRRTIEEDLYKKNDWAENAKLGNPTTDAMNVKNLSAESINLMGRLHATTTTTATATAPTTAPAPAPASASATAALPVALTTGKLALKNPSFDEIKSYGLAFKNNGNTKDVIVAKKNGRVISSAADVEADALKLGGAYTFADSNGSLKLAGGEGVQVGKSLDIKGGLLASSLSVGGDLGVDNFRALSGAIFDGAIISNDQICIGNVCINQDRFKELAGGEYGPPGPMGAQGPTGPQGERGRTGARGNRGNIGPQGLQGPLGKVGEQGLQGDKGIQGIMGDQGDRGEEGPVGPQGLTGSVGVQGKNGVDISNIVTEREGDQVFLVIRYDDGKMSRVPFPGVGKVITGVSIKQTSLVLKFGDGSETTVQLPIPTLPPLVQGPPGPKGNQGLQGAAGARGPRGETGMSITDIQPISVGVLRVTYSDGRSENLPVNSMFPKYMTDVRTVDGKIMSYYSDNTSQYIATLPN